MKSLGDRNQTVADVFCEIYNKFVSLWMENGGTNFQSLLRTSIIHPDQKVKNQFKNIFLVKVSDAEYELSFDMEEDGRIFRCYGTFQFRLITWGRAKVKSSLCRRLMSVGYSFDSRGKLLMNNGQIEFSAYAGRIALLDCRKMNCRVSMCYEYIDSDSSKKLIRKATQEFGQIVFTAYPLFARTEREVVDCIIPAVIEAKSVIEGKFLDMVFLIRCPADCKVGNVIVPVGLELSCGRIAGPRVLIGHSGWGIDMKVDWL